MALILSNMAQGRTKVPSLTSALISGLLYPHTIVGNLAAGDIIDMGPIEPGVAPVDCHLISDDLDSNGAPTITLSVGILNAAKTDLDVAATSTYIAASVVGQAGGIVHAINANAYLSGPSSAERRLGIKVVAAAATIASDGKKVAVILDAVTP